MYMYFLLCCFNTLILKTHLTTDCFEDRLSVSNLSSKQSIVRCKDPLLILYYIYTCAVNNQVFDRKVEFDQNSPHGQVVKSADFINPCYHSIISLLCLVRVRALHRAHGRLSKFCFLVCQVFFLVVHPFIPQLLMNPSNVSRNNLERDLKLNKKNNKTDHLTKI